MFFATLGVMRRETLDETMEEIKHKFIRLYKAEWIGKLFVIRLLRSSKLFTFSSTVWPVAQFVQFQFLPHRYRVLYDNTISLGYDVYTSYVINEPIPQVEKSLNVEIIGKNRVEANLKANQLMRS